MNNPAEGITHERHELVRTGYWRIGPITVFRKRKKWGEDRTVRLYEEDVFHAALVSDGWPKDAGYIVFWYDGDWAYTRSDNVKEISALELLALEAE